MQYDCYQPVPTDSTASCNFDADNDGIADFLVVISNWYEFVSASNPCGNFQYVSSISSLKAGDSLAANGNSLLCARVFAAGEVINESSLYSPGIETVRAYWMAMPCGNDHPEGPGYYGFKMKKGTGYMYGWILLDLDWVTHSVTITGYAVNKTVNHRILAGQIQ